MMEKFEAFKKLGASGVLVYLLVAALPFVAANIGTWRSANRADQAYADSAWKDFATELRVELSDLKDELKATQVQLYSLKGELSFLRQADSQAPVAIWELNSNHEIRFFNPTFTNIIWGPTGIDPDTVRGKKWNEIFPMKTAAPYIRDDLRVKNCRCPTTSDDLFIIDETGQKTYWHTTKWPIIQDGFYTGLKGLAYPLKEQNR